MHVSMNHVSFSFLGFDRYVLLFLSGPSHSSDRMRLSVSIPTCLSGSVRMVGWSCRCRGCYYGFDVVCMFVCLLLNMSVVYDISFTSLSV